MATKFAQFLQDNKIDPRRIVVASQELERLRPEDSQGEASEACRQKGGHEAGRGRETAKPRSGTCGDPAPDRVGQCR